MEVKKETKRPVPALGIGGPIKGTGGAITAAGSVFTPSNPVNCFAIPMAAGSTLPVPFPATLDGMGGWSVKIPGLSPGTYLFEVMAAGEGSASAAVNVTS